MAGKRDAELFDLIWLHVICPEIERLCDGQYVTCDNLEYAKQAIWDAYCEANWECANTYLAVKDGQLDRHKVAACYMFAILEVFPLDINIAEPDDNRRAYLSNERLSVTVGVSVLGIFDHSIAEELHNRSDKDDDTATGSLKLDEEGAYRSAGCLTDREYRQVIAQIENGVNFPVSFPTPGGSYYDSVLIALCSAVVEENCNILMLALLLYHWEAALLGSEYHERFLACRDRGDCSAIDTPGSVV